MPSTNFFCSETVQLLGLCGRADRADGPFYPTVSLQGPLEWFGSCALALTPVSNARHLGSEVGWGQMSGPQTALLRGLNWMRSRRWPAPSSWGWGYWPWLGLAERRRGGSSTSVGSAALWVALTKLKSGPAFAFRWGAVVVSDSVLGPQWFEF